MNKPQMNKISPIKSSLNKIAKIFKMTSIEKELEQSKSYLSIALKGTENGEWNWNLDTNKIDLSPDAWAILGYEKTEKNIRSRFVFGND